MTHDEPVTVLRDGRLRAAGIRRGSVVAYDWGFHQDGTDHVQRTFVLLDDHMQIDQPVAFPPGQRGWWYCDLVSLEWAAPGLLRTDDRWIDVIVGPPDHPYRLLDLDDYAAALADGRLAPAEAADGLTRVQRFLDHRLNRRHDTTRTWPAFPPAEIRDLGTADLPQNWNLLA
ncbi:hypothetical protein GCM10010441_25000 [Kitasatospora paracochleata]|uniref:DUF402 domain-containing protein n=1 Tax=Kitasatospora paracochleata TaxID=58354 RepID=A0ABT1J0W0_9ACTN|nr:DUF402 domain-containing protein [Kitasatospora paracochleata]MCP2311055.1 hypothetical protein [Kitasatospora paracochleata]